MRLFVAVGKIARVDHRAKGDTRICVLTIPFRSKDTTMWVEIVGFDDVADAWATEFKKGDVVVFSGTPEIRTYLKADQTPAASLRIRTTRWGVRKVWGPQSDQPQDIQEDLLF